MANPQNAELLSGLKNSINPVLEGLQGIQKKGKSSEFDGRDNGQVKKSLSLIVWPHEGSKHTSKFEKYGENSGLAGY